MAGKGIAAALFMARSLALLRAEAMRRRPLHEMLGRVNETLARGNELATFVALSAGSWMRRAACCATSTAGGAPFVRRAGQWSRLSMPRGLVVGSIPGFTYESARTRLGPHDVLVLFGDGVTEATSPAGQHFGVGRLQAILEAGAGASALSQIEAVRNGVAAFAEGGPPADDLTLLVVRRRGT